MSYTDTLLSTGEQILRRERQHWFILVYGSRWAILALVAGIVLLFLSNGIASDGGLGVIKGLLGYVVLALIAGSLVWLLWTYVRWVNEEYVITNRRVIQCEGVINKHASDSALEKINDAAIDQSVFGRIFGFGDLDILTASETGVSLIKMMDDPIEFKKAMLDAKHELDVEIARPSMPSPALRAPSAGPSADPTSTAQPMAPVPAVAAAPTPTPPVTAPLAPAPPAAAAPAAPPEPPKMAADEITRTLASLADLRDRGAITPEEYEAKKADLLGRL